MMQKHKLWTVCFISIGFLALIFDSKTAINGALSGVDICTRTVIPSIFPFLVLSNLLTRALAGTEFSLLKKIGNRLHIPHGTEVLLIPAFLGGYPAGAQCVAYAHKNRQISHNTAKKMMSFCNNAGPAFLFGMISPLFSDKRIPWILWGIHVGSAVIVAFCTKLPEESKAMLPNTYYPSSDFMYASVSATGIICGWIILFRMILCFLQRWFLWLFSAEVQVLVAGILELSNGCLMLQNIENVPLRLVYASGMLSLGGLCIMMQTRSVAGDLFGPDYINGKLLQTGISVLTAASLVWPRRILPILIPLFLLLLLIQIRKNSSIPKPSVV